jgi:hypothetical protein
MVNAQSTRPATITIAAILWIVYGGVAMLGSLMTGPGMLGMAIGELIAVAFLITGIRTLSGSPNNVFVAGIFSIVWGTLILIAFLAAVAFARELTGETGAKIVLVTIGLLVSGTLITAGILACMGNTKFLTWRQHRGLVPGPV